MVDAARQMLDELMGRNRNLHPSESRKINWEDPEFCQYYFVKFCPHELFINTRADLGPCNRIHDDEAKKLFEESRPTARKRSVEDDFLRFCNTMLNDVDRKIQKGKQRLELMNRDKPAQVVPHLSKFQEQLQNLDARIKKLLSEAEEAGIRGDVDQAQDLMVHCERLREERDAFVAQHENTMSSIVKPANNLEKINEDSVGSSAAKIEPSDMDKSPKTGEESMESNNISTNNGDTNGEKKYFSWSQDIIGIMNEKQMEVCETCGAFLIVGDAQQRIEDHLMGKQHLGYSRLRSAVAELNEKRQKEREDDERRRRDDRSHPSSETERRRDNRDRDHRGHSRDYSGRRSSERRHYSSKSHHSNRSRSHNQHSRRSRDRRDKSHSRSRSRSRY